MVKSFTRAQIKLTRAQARVGPGIDTPLIFIEVQYSYLIFAEYYFALEFNQLQFLQIFLQVGIQKTDRDVTRFLWFKDLTNLDVLVENLDTYQFCRVRFGIICSPFLSAGTIKYHLKQIGTSVALKISDNIYVDNVLLGANSVQNTYEIYLESKDIFKKASMNLREWISNCSEFLNLLPESDVVRGSILKIFGIPWNYEEDYLGFNSNQVDIPHTKRGVLKILAKIFDPLGLVTPVTFFGKVFLQELWKEGISWDESL